MNLNTYLALLSWQNQRVQRKDFKILNESSISSPEEIKTIVSSVKLQEFLKHNPLWWKRAEKDYQYCKQKNYHITFLGETHYPKNFEQLEILPTLTYIGEPPKQDTSFPVSIVGSRKIHELTLNWMDFYLPDVVKANNICIVSGGARGVDQKAHQIAVRLKTFTTCFVPSGLDHLYPSKLNGLKTQILDSGGTFISCFSPFVRMKKSFFHIRNSLMACYSKLIIIMQAEMRSGTMITAHRGLDHGTPIAVVPGPPLLAGFSGNLQLLYDGAFLLRDGADLNLLIKNLKFIKAD